MSKIKIESLGDFKKVIKKKIGITESQNHRWIFRGQKDPNWDLETSLARSNNERPVGEELNQKAQDFLRGFLRNIPVAPPKPKFDPWHKALLALGQHYGFKTNLLDWTTNPEYALFFALELDPNITEFKIFGDLPPVFTPVSTLVPVFLN